MSKLVRKSCAVAVAACMFGGGTVATAQRAPQAEAASPTAEALAAARDLLAASGVAKQFEAMLPAMMTQMSQAFVQMQPQHEKIIRETFAQVGQRGIDRKHELIDEIAKLYSRSLSVADMRELTRFFYSPSGQRFIDVQLKSLPEAMRIGQQWGEKIGREIDAEMRSELRKKGIPI